MKIHALINAFQKFFLRLASTIAISVLLVMYPASEDSTSASLFAKAYAQEDPDDDMDFDDDDLDDNVDDDDFDDDMDDDFDDEFDDEDDDDNDDADDFADADFDDPDIEPGEFGDNEYYDDEVDGVLGVNLSQEGVERARALGFIVERRVMLTRLRLALTRLRPPKGQSYQQALTELRNAAPDNYFEANSLYRLAQGNACKGIRCYGSALIGWDQEWTQRDSRCGRGVRLGMIDTAVDQQHPALREQRLSFRAFNERGVSSTQHGTAVASLLIGNTASDFPGLLPGAELLAVDVFERDAKGRLKATAEHVAEALDWLVEEDIHIINLSIAGPENDMLRTALERAHTQGALIIAAAGNGGPQAPPAYPAAYANVLAITAVDRFMRPYNQANRGDYVALSAPGVSIWIPKDQGGHFDNGTSYATAFATAVSALLAEQNGGFSRNQKKAAVQVERLLEQMRADASDLGDPGKDETFGWGLVKTGLRCR